MVPGTYIPVRQRTVSPDTQAERVAGWRTRGWVNMDQAGVKPGSNLESCSQRCRAARDTVIHHSIFTVLGACCRGQQLRKRRTRRRRRRRRRRRKNKKKEEEKERRRRNKEEENKMKKWRRNRRRKETSKSTNITVNS